MEKIELTDDFYDTFPRDDSYGSESRRFHDDEYFYKILKRKYLDEDREQIVEKLFDLHHKNIVTPIKCIYENNKFVGYSMKYYKDYINMVDYIETVEDFDERKDFLIRISEVFDYFDSQKFAYFDIHGYNIICKEKDFKIIDLDGGTFKGLTNRGLDYNTSIRIERKVLAKFLLSKLYDMLDYNWIYVKRNIKKDQFSNFYNNLPYNVKELYDYVLCSDFHLYFDLTKALEQVDEDMMYTTKALSLKKSLY